MICFISEFHYRTQAYYLVEWQFHLSSLKLQTDRHHHLQFSFQWLSSSRRYCCQWWLAAWQQHYQVPLGLSTKPSFPHWHRKWSWVVEINCLPLGKAQILWPNFLYEEIVVINLTLILAYIILSDLDISFNNLWKRCTAHVWLPITAELVNP